MYTNVEVVHAEYKYSQAVSIKVYSDSDQQINVKTVIHRYIWNMYIQLL